METNWKFILQETDTQYYCILCGCDVFGSHNVQRHYNGSRHADSLELYGDDITYNYNNQYICYLCDCNISGYLNVYRHVMGQTHQNLLNESETSEESFEYVAINARDFIVTDYSDNIECILCNVDIYNNWHVPKHLSGQTHRNAVMTYGDDILKKSGTSWYYCKLCDCEISSYKNVYQHITGSQHENFLF